jgi:hypothetical protein
MLHLDDDDDDDDDEIRFISLFICTIHRYVGMYHINILT